MEELLLETFKTNFDASDILEFGKEKIIIAICECITLTSETKFVIINMIYELSKDFGKAHHVDYCSISMKDILEKTFYKNLEIVNLETNRLIMMVIEYKNFTILFKQIILVKLFQKIPDNINFGDCVNTNPLIMLCHNFNIDSKERLELIIFLIESIKLDINKISIVETQKLIMQIIKHKKFSVNFKQRILEKLFQRIHNDVNFGNCEHSNPLLMLCHYHYDIDYDERLKLVIFLVETIKVDVNKISEYDTTAIMFAYQNNYKNIVEYLVSKDAILTYTLANNTVINILKFGNKDNQLTLAEILIKLHSGIVKNNKIMPTKKASVKKVIDFNTFTRANMDDINPDDPNLLEQMGLDPFPNFSKLSDDEQYWEYRKYFMKLVILEAITEKYMDRAFAILKKLRSKEFIEKDVGAKISKNDDSDDFVEQ